MKSEDDSAKEIAEFAVETATFLYGVKPLASPFQSTRSHVFRLDFGDALETKILKIAKAGNEADVLREQKIISTLSVRGFEVPTIEFTQEDVTFSMPFTAMPFIQGGWIGDASRMAAPAAQAIYEHLGHFIARLSVLDAEDIPGGRRGAEVYTQIESTWAEGAELLRLHPRHSPCLEAILEQGRDRHKDTSGFVHWDGTQVITDGMSTFTVIDWGGAGAGHRLVDLGVFLVDHAFWAFLQQRRGLPFYPEWRSAVLKGFLGARPMTEELRRCLHFLGASQFILDAMWMAKHNHPRADDALTFIEAEDADINSNI